jgi:hypothetical protein
MNSTTSKVTRYGSGLNNAAAIVQSSQIVDVVGCAKADMGRSCPLHPVCGLSVDELDLLSTQKCILRRSEGISFTRITLITQKPSRVSFPASLQR